MSATSSVGPSPLSGDEVRRGGHPLMAANRAGGRPTLGRTGCGRMRSVARPNEYCETPLVAKERRSRKADRVSEWAVSVRLNDGRVLFWCGAQAERIGQDWAGESQAYRFATQAEAKKYAAQCSTNSAAWEYQVVLLKQPR